MKKTLYYLLVCLCIFIGVFFFWESIDYEILYSANSAENLSGAFVVFQAIKWGVLIFGIYYSLILGGFIIVYLKSRKIQFTLSKKKDKAEKIIIILFTFSGGAYLLYLIFDMLPSRNWSGVIAMVLFFISNYMSYIFVENIYYIWHLERKESL